MFEEIKKVIVDTLSCDEDKVTPEASLTDDLGADSLDAVELVMELEEKLDIQLDLDRDLENIDELVKFVEEKMEG